ncbi:hypothetical protein K470DRAFT_259301 [Piedraia hortae CBS 480.64]|uniref:DUF8035 domain-containing protein n=1 Tax=Piedraia hortae CBS 480.64 TaxID=1314780 RepID=A0A6A7BUV0_9PEZI|nr:hypothetical protein K470DRAFT_259301 [Piedraia hortae CBS 480.64]
MSRRDYRYEETDVYRRERDYDHVDGRSRVSRAPRADVIVEERRERSRPRVPDFLRDDYDRKSNAGAIVVRREEREDDVYSRAPARKRSTETVRTRMPERDEFIYKERETARAPRREYVEKEQVIRERTRSRPAPRDRDEELDITVRKDPGREVDEIRFRRGAGDPPIDEPRHRSPVREVRRERIEIERSTSRPRPTLVARKNEEWVVRPRRGSSAHTPPPPRDDTKEEIIIRRKERSPSPEPPPAPRSPSPPSPIVRPPIIQEVITHRRTIDHGVQRARSPTPPPPAPPSPPREDDLEIEIRRQGTRNGEPYKEKILIEKEDKHRSPSMSTHRNRSASRPRRSPSPHRRVYDDEFVAEADYYNRRVRDRAYPGEAWNGATRDWGLVDVPPGTERVRMDGVGGGQQEIFWDRYAGERRAKYSSGERVYEDRYGNIIEPPPAPAAPPAVAPPPAPAVEPPETELRETRITERRVVEEQQPAPRPKRDRMWTEVTKDLVLKEALETLGYDYEETEDYFFVMQYLRYDDVRRLVQLSTDIRKERRQRIKEIQLEREEYDAPQRMLPPPPIARNRDRDYEREYERDVYVERDRYRR